MTEKKSPENHLLILRDVVAERKKEAPTPASKKKYDDREEAQEQEDARNRFQTIQSNPIVEDYNKRAQTAERTAASDQDDGSTTRVTGNNYREVYLQQRNAERRKAEAAAQGKDSPDKKKQEELDKKAREKKAADEQRFRAREIQDQLVWWQRQFGMGQYDDQTVTKMLADLRQELAGIPQAFW